MIDTGDEISRGDFYLSHTEELPGVGLVCNQDSGAWDANIWWPDVGIIQVDDANATYGNSEEEVYLNIFVVVTATDSPVRIEMSIFGSPEGITDLIEDSEPGTLVVNGVDVLQAMQADDAVLQIP